MKFQSVWQRRGWGALLLWPLSQFYGLVICARLLLYKHGIFRSTCVGVPVLIVGNLVAGGGGKTPLVIALVNHLQHHGIKAGVISRGYGRSSRQSLEVGVQTPIHQSGDEPALIKQVTGAPVFVAVKRADAAKALLRAHPTTQVIICDDGLQHYALARDIEIAVFDERGLGNGWLLPAGPLREPWPPLHRASIDLILHTGRAAAFGGFTSSRQLGSMATAADGSKVMLSSLIGQPLAALAAIATPHAFFDMLAEAGMTLAQTIALPDHHDFSGYIFPVSPGTTILCTEKDAVKLFQLPSRLTVRLLAVPLIFAPDPAFIRAIDSLLAPLLSPLPSRDGH